MPSKSNGIKARELQADAERMTPKHQLGRPTLYNEAYCEHLIDYFGSSKVQFPSFAGFAALIGVDKDTIQEWKKVHPNFSVSYKKAQAIQESRLVEGALFNRLNPTFSIFFAKNNLGYTDKVESDNVNTNHNLSQDVGELSIEELQDRAAALRTSAAT